MGRLVLWMQQTLDGFTEGPNGEFDWPVLEEDLHTTFNEVVEARAGAFAYGRTTFEMMAGYWPGEVDAEHDNSRRFARTWVPMRKYVVSSTLTGDLDFNATAVRPAQLAELKASTDGDVIFIGGASTAGELVRLGLVDEYHVFTHPVLLGGGTRLYPARTSRIELSLVEVQTFGGGVVLSRYVPR